MTDKTTEAFDAWWADEGEQSLYALNTTTDDDIKILAGLAWEVAMREAMAKQEKQEPVYAFRRRGLDDFCTCTKERYEELADMPNLFEVTTFYAAPVRPVKQEPVAVISESAIGLVKLHSNGACLPFGIQLYAAPVSAEAIRAETLEQAAQWFEGNEDDVGYAIATEIRGLK